MLDKDISPDDFHECPECEAELIKEGDKWEGSYSCSECEYCISWDNLP